MKRYKLLKEKALLFITTYNQRGILKEEKMEIIKKCSAKVLLSFTVVFAMLCSINPAKVSASGVATAISDFNITGAVGESITPVTITCTISGGVWSNIPNEGEDYTEMFEQYFVTNLPAGLVATIENLSEDEKILRVKISGTPTEVVSCEAILGPSLTTLNPNCKFEIHAHIASESWSKDATDHWHECTTNDGKKMDLASHTFGDWVIDTPATETTEGSKHRDCTVCSQRETVEIPTIVVTPETPVITAGDGSTHQISDGKDMTLTCSGELEDLNGIYIDGKLVDVSNYSLKSGSTILTLKASYLDTLSAGKHTLKFQYKDNVSAETDFTVIAKSDAIPPQTRDTSSTILYFGLIILSGCIAGFGFKKKKSLIK